MTPKHTTSKRRVDDPSNAQPSLLQIPWTDFPSIRHPSHSPNDPPEDSLLLLQLPSDIPVSTFLQAAANHPNETEHVRIMIRDQETDNDTSNPACSLVIPSLGRTLVLSRVETSNTYILVPPQPGNQDQASHVSMNARLLRERDTFVIEAEDITNHLSSTVMGRFQLKQFLQSFSFPVTKVGCTMLQLTQQFPFSQKEIQHALHHIHAFNFPPTSNEHSTTFGWIREEEFYWSVQAILFALDEFDSIDDVTQKIQLDSLVPQAAHHLQSLLVHTILTDKETQTLVHHVLRYYFAKSHEETVPHWILDVVKVSTLLARILFLEQSKWVKQDFIEKWHSRMPGVGTLYQPHIQNLKGLCVEQTIQDVVYLRYFPHDSLPMELQSRFQKLFQLSPKWSWPDLEPYIIPWIDGLHEYDPGESKGVDPMDPIVSPVWMKYATLVKDDQGQVIFTAIK
jgi:hypothetical protein